MFFRFGGRIGRAPYILAFLLIGLVQSFPMYRYLISVPDSAEAEFWSVVFLFVLIGSIYCYMAITAKRLHDLGRSGYEALWLFVPIISIIALVLLCAVPGEPGPNRFARDANSPE